MAEVVFLTGVADKLAFAARLVRQKHRDGGRMAVFGAPPLLARLDQALWVQDEQEFLPHLRLRAGEAPPPGAAQRTPIWLLDRPDASLRCESAMNLGIEQLDWLLGHERIAEVVGTSDDDRAAGQLRWKRYKALGHTLVHRPQDAAAAR